VRERFLVTAFGPTGRHGDASGDQPADGPVRCGFDVSQVTEVLPMTAVARVPWAPRWVCGVMNHQGRLLTLVDLGRFLELNDSAPPSVAVVIDRADLNLALCVSEVAIVEARDAVQVGQIKQFLAQASWITEALSTPELSFQHLDLQRVIDAIEEAF
jgi:chemotaxis signal transduction protein